MGQGRYQKLRSMFIFVDKISLEKTKWYSGGCGSPKIDIGCDFTSFDGVCVHLLSDLYYFFNNDSYASCFLVKIVVSLYYNNYHASYVS